MAEASEIVVNVDEISKQGWYINDVTYTESGKIVLTGWALGRYSHITVIDTRTHKVIRQDKIKTEKNTSPDRYCAAFPFGSKVFTVCWPDEVGVYDVENGSHHVRFIGDTSNWPRGRLVRSVTGDTRRNKFLVCSNSFIHYVFDADLNCCYSMEQPKGFNYWSDVSFSKNHFLICDYFGKNVSAVTYSDHPEDCPLLHDLRKPTLNGAEWRPLSVCSDKRMACYVLWEAFTPHQKKCITKYSHKVHELIKTWLTDDDAYSISFMSEEDEYARGVATLIVATLKSGKIHLTSILV